MDSRGAPRTFLFTDMVGSTQLWQRYPSAMQLTMEEHDLAIRSAVEDRGGRIFAGGGDGFGVVFDDPSSAVDAAVATQRSLEKVRVGDDVVRVRIGLHTGPAQERGGDFFGVTVNRAARIASAAHGGQVLLSAVTAEMIDRSILTQLGEVRLADLLEPVVVFQVGDQRFPPIRALDPNRHNLPFRFTSIIGRGELIERVIDALAENRLVSLVGPGGIGKTTVALEAAARVLPDSDRGVWLAELDRLSPDAEVEAAIAEALGLNPVEGWRRTAARRDQLVVLDNAEHVIEPAAQTIAALLRAGPAIRVLVTSREALGIPGEAVIDVPPLDADAATDLFIDRAESVASDIEMVEELVTRTDGIPLAAELIAAHAGRATIADLVLSLDEYGVGHFVARGGVERHRSARAAIEWSVELLTPSERSAFEALAVFNGEFTIQQAATLADTPRSTITGLVEKSLLQPAGDRYRLLEPIGEVATERLVARGALTEMQYRHAAMVAATVDEIAGRLGPREYEAWVDEFDQPIADFLAALGWATDHADVHLLVKLYLGIPGLLLATRMANEGYARVAAAGAIWQQDPVTYRWELHRHAWIEDFCNFELEARERVLALQALPEVHSDPHLNAACSLVHLNTHQYTPGPIEVQEALVDEVKAYQGDTGWWEPGDPDAFLGGAYLRIGDLDRARRALEAALKDPGMRPVNRLLTLGDLAEVEREAGNLNRSLDILDQIVAADDETERYVAQEKAHAYIAMGDPNQARDYLQPLIEWDLSQAQPTTMSFCAAADYFREVGDHRTATWLLSKMLEGLAPAAQVHQRIVDQAKATLGDAQFEAEWAKGRDMDIYALYALLAEDL